MAQLPELLPATLTSHIRATDQVPATLLQIQLAADAPGKAMKAGLSTWTTITHMGDPNAVPGQWLWLGLFLVFTAIWEVSQQMKDLLLSSSFHLLLSRPLCLSNKQKTNSF